MQSKNRIDNVRKIAVLRANALGDFLLSLPALEALSQAYPQAEIVLLGREWHAAFLKNRPGPVDRVIPVPYGGIGGEVVDQQPDMTAFFEALTAENFDLALQMHGGGYNSNPFISKLGARYTAGSRDFNAPPLDRWVRYMLYQPEVIRYLEIVSLVGAEPVSYEPKVEVTPVDLAESLAVVPETKKPLVVIHPGAIDPRRRWPTSKFAEVADAIAKKGYRIAVTGSTEEISLVEAVISAMQEEALDLGGQLSLNGLTGLLSRSTLLVSNDTGPAHLARAVGVPTVTLYWIGNLITAGPLSRAKNRPLVAFQINCPYCGEEQTKTRCEHTFSVVNEISVEEVLNQAFDLLETPG